MNKRIVSLLSVIVIVIFGLQLFINTKAAIADGGKEYYVAKTGSNWSDGSIEHPFPTILKGMNAMRPGDTLIIREGIYCEMIDYYDKYLKDANSDGWRTIKNYPGETVILSGLEKLGEGITFNNTAYWHIQGLKFTGYTGAGIYIRNNVQNMVLDGLTIWGLDGPEGSTAGTEGIMGYGNNYNITVQNCEIYNIGLKQNKQSDHGIYIGYGVNLWTITGNNIHDNSGAGIHLYGEPGPNEVIITDNTLYNNHNWGLVIGSNATGNRINNNKFYNNGDSDVYILGSSCGNTLTNNIFGSTNGNYNVALGDTVSTHNNFDYNVYGKQTSSVYYGVQSGGTLDFSQFQALGQESHGYYDTNTVLYIMSTKNYTTQRLFGNNRYDTAKAIAVSYDTGIINNVVIASGLNFPDALSGNILAKKLNAPILLVGLTPNESPETFDYIKNHLTPYGNIYILGGPGAVNESIVNELVTMGFGCYNIKRLWGNGRYDTNLSIFNELSTPKGTPVVIASGNSFADVLSISSVAAVREFPIILSDQDNLPEQAIEILQNVQPSQVYIVGGTGVLTDNVKADIKSVTGLSDDQVIRLGGSDRYDTSLRIADYFKLNSDTVAFAWGEDFPDALVGGLYAAKLNAPVILVGSEITRQKIYIDNTDYVKQIIFGGSGVISDRLQSDLAR